jgi:hypothetical protein
MKVSFRGHELIVGSNKLAFLTEIFRVMPVPCGTIVLLKAISDREKRNVFFVADDGKVKWQIENFSEEPLSLYSGWVDISYKNGELIGYNWLGYECKIDLETGKILERIFTK